MFKKTALFLWLGFPKRCEFISFYTDDNEGWEAGSEGGRASKVAPKKDFGSLGEHRRRKAKKLGTNRIYGTKN